MQGCEPVINQSNGNLTINYLDTCEAPLSPMHLAFSAGLLSNSSLQRSNSDGASRPLQALL
jgi:hypothetical protein